MSILKDAPNGEVVGQVEGTHQAMSPRPHVNVPHDANDALAQTLSHVSNRLGGRIITPDQAREILGPQLFFGIDSARALYGTNISDEDVANIPFNLTEQDAVAAARLKHSISLHVDRLGNGDPLTMVNLSRHVKETQGCTAIYGGRGGLYVSDKEYANTPDRLGWVETSTKGVWRTLDKDSVEAMDMLIQYLRNGIYEGRELPAQYEAAIHEFEEKKREIEQILRGANQEGGKTKGQITDEIFQNLQVVKLFLPSHISMLQDITNYNSVGPFALDENFIRTNTMSSTISDTFPDGKYTKPSVMLSDRNRFAITLFSRSLSL